MDYKLAATYTLVNSATLHFTQLICDYSSFVWGYEFSPKPEFIAVFPSVS